MWIWALPWCCCEPGPLSWFSMHFGWPEIFRGGWWTFTFLCSSFLAATWPNSAETTSLRISGMAIGISSLLDSFTSGSLCSSWFTCKATKFGSQWEGSERTSAWSAESLAQCQQRTPAETMVGFRHAEMESSMLRSYEMAHSHTDRILKFIWLPRRQLKLGLQKFVQLCNICIKYRCICLDLRCLCDSLYSCRVCARDEAAALELLFSRPVPPSAPAVAVGC